MDEHGRLFQLIAAGDTDAVARLIVERPDLVHARDGDGATGLHHAAF